MFEIFQKATISFCQSLGPPGKPRFPLDGFSRKFDVRVVFANSVVQIQVLIKSDTNNGYFTWIPMHIFNHIALNSPYNEICSRQKLYRKTKHILCSIIFFRKSCRLWNHVKKYSKAGQIADDNLAHALCMLGNYGYTYKHTHPEYVILIAFPWQQWLHKRASVLRYAYLACFLPFSVLQLTSSATCVTYDILLTF